MTSDGCGNGTARGKGGAMRGASLAGSVVACTGGAAAVMMDGWELSKVGSNVERAVDES